MATHSATMDRDADGPATRKPARKRRAGAAKAAGSRSPGRRPAPGGGAAWLQAVRMGVLMAAVAFVAAAVVSVMAGHAPSWRSLSVVCLQSLPLLPGIALFWRAAEALRARRPGLPLALWLGLVFVGTLAVMLLAPGLVFAAHSRSVAFAEDHDGEMGLLHHVVGTGAALYLYATTAFRLWWPWGAALPALLTVLYWRAAHTGR